MEKKKRGPLIIIGGAEDKEGECLILRYFLSLIQKDGPVVIIPTASLAPLEAGELYQQVFHRLGARESYILAISTRQEAEKKEVSRLLEKAGGIFFTGGDQLRLTSLLGGTPAEEAIKKAHLRGTVIAGTSAGAAAMSEIMIVGGEGEEAPKKNTLHMAPGLGLLEGIVIDQHFAQRGRLGRLLTAVAQNPHTLGAGIDEDTALVVFAETGIVIGSGTVTIVDGRHIQHTNISEQKPDEPLVLTNVLLHILPAGFGYHLEKKEVLVPSSFPATRPPGSENTDRR